MGRLLNLDRLIIMIKKRKLSWKEKINFIFSSIIFYLIFILFVIILHKSSIFINNKFGIIVLSLYVLAYVFFLGILIIIYFIFVKFIRDKTTLTKKEFERYAKKPNNESSGKGVIFFDDFTNFLIFSLFFGLIYMERPVWFFRELKKIVSKSYSYRKAGFKRIYGWRKIWDAEIREYSYLLFVWPLK